MTAVIFFLSGCGVKDKAINLKNSVLDPDSGPAEYSAEDTELTGMLLVLEPRKCPLTEGCGPQYSLIGRNFEARVAITGDISPEHHNLILSVVGDPSPISRDLAGKSGYENIEASIAVNRYRLRSSIPYHQFLVEESAAYITENYGCNLLWDKSFSWNIENNTPHLKVLLTDTLSEQPWPWIELTYNGNDGSLIAAAENPAESNPCGGQQQ